jgi:hypothetical protein
MELIVKNETCTVCEPELTERVVFENNCKELVSKDCDNDPLNITWRKFCYDDDKVKDKAVEDANEFHDNPGKISHQVYFRQDYTTPSYRESKQNISQDLYNSTTSKNTIAEGSYPSTPVVRNIVFQTNLETTTAERPASILSTSTTESSRNPIIITTENQKNNLVDETNKILVPTEPTTKDTYSEQAANLLRLCFLDATFCTPNIVQNPQDRTTTTTQTTQATTATLQTTNNIFPPTTTSEEHSKLADLLQRCFLDTKFCQFDSSDNQIVEPTEQQTTTEITSTSTSTRNPLQDAVRRCLFQGICNN